MREYCALMDGFRDIEELAFLRAGIIASTIANCNRDPERNPEPFTPKDFMPRHTEEPEPEMTDEQKAAEWNLRMSVINAKCGGTDG